MKERTKIAAQLLIVCYAVLLSVVLFLSRGTVQLGGAFQDVAQFSDLIAAYLGLQILCWGFLLYKQAWAWWTLVLTAILLPILGTATTLGILKNPGLPTFSTNRIFDLFELAVLLILLTDLSPLKKKSTKSRKRRKATTARRSTTSATRSRSRTTRRRRRRRNTDYYYD